MARTITEPTWSPASGRDRHPLILPFDLRVDPLDRMLNFEIADDPHYEGLEIQLFDDDIHGTGMLIFLQRREDGRIDVYRQPALQVDREGYGLGAGLGRWEEAAVDPARLEITALGAEADVRFSDAEGRTIEVRIDDRGRRRRRPATFLAPVSAGIEHPISMLLVHMRGFDLLRTSGLEPVILIDGRRVSTGTLPGASLHRRWLIKYATGIAAVSFNTARRGTVPTVELAEPGAVELDRRGERPRIAAVSETRGGHDVRLELSPSFPDIHHMVDGEVADGTWWIGIHDDPAVVGGRWRVGRSAGEAELTLDVTRGWKPRGLPALMRVVTTVVPVFRTWPTTYRWTATVSLGEEPTMRSRWQRVGEADAKAYRRATGSDR